MDMEKTHPLNHHYTLKDQYAYIIINACVFVNAIQKEMGYGEDLSQPPLLN